MELSIAIMMHPSRREFLPYLEERLGPVPVAMDRGLGVWDTCKRAWECATGDWHLVVQDDALICRDFRQRIRPLITDRTAYSLYFGWRQRFEAAAPGYISAGGVTLPSITIPDPKVYEVSDSIPDGPYLSSLDQRFDLVRPLLEELFPEPCQYEAADTATVIRQEDGPMYVSPSRVIRHGVLIAYAGESMTEAEAHRRGLETTEEPAATEPTPEPDYDAMNVRELKDLLDERGVAYPKRANRSMLLTLVE